MRIFVSVATLGTMRNSLLSRSKITLSVALLASSVVLASCGSSATTALAGKNKVRNVNRGNGLTYSISVAAQTSNGFAVTVKSISLKDVASTGTGGYIVVASDIAGKTGQILGYTRLPNRNTKNVKIIFKNKLTTGEYFFLLYPSGRIPTLVSIPLKKTLAKVTVG